jgi:leucyl aminopeptidase (aminopeptidase T)
MPEASVPPDVAEICRTILTKSLRLRRGENVIIETWTHMLPWANEMVLEARRAGIRPTLLYQDEATYWRSVEACKPADVGKMPAPELGAMSKAEGYVFLWGPEDRPRQQALPKEQRAALTAYNAPWYQAAGRAHLRGCRIELGRATSAAAQFYGVDLASWQHSLIDASRVDPGELARDAARLAERLRRGKRLRVHHANGTDLSLQLAGRTPVVDDGVVDAKDIRAGQNMASFPGGAVYVAPEERSVTGRFVANRTSYPTSGALVGGRWTFEENHLASFEYAAGEDRFKEAFEGAGPGKDRPGFLSVGLNPRLRGAPGLEDFERGTILLGIGGNSAFGGKTRSSFQTWLGLGGAHLEIDGTTVVADGELLLP